MAFAQGNNFSDVMLRPRCLGLRFRCRFGKLHCSYLPWKVCGLAIQMDILVYVWHRAVISLVHLFNFPLWTQNPKQPSFLGAITIISFQSVWAPSRRLLESTFFFLHFSTFLAFGPAPNVTEGIPASADDYRTWCSQHYSGSGDRPDRQFR